MSGWSTPPAGASPWRWVAYPIVHAVIPPVLEKAIMIEPTPPVLAAIKAADVWIEYDYQLFLYPRLEAGDGCRHPPAYRGCHGCGDMLINVIGRYDHKKIVCPWANRICDLTNAAKKMRITSPRRKPTYPACAKDVLCNQSGHGGPIKKGRIRPCWAGQNPPSAPLKTPSTEYWSLTADFSRPRRSA